MRSQPTAALDVEVAQGFTERPHIRSLTMQNGFMHTVVIIHLAMRLAMHANVNGMAFFRIEQYFQEIIDAVRHFLLGERDHFPILDVILSVGVFELVNFTVVLALMKVVNGGFSNGLALGQFLDRFSSVLDFSHRIIAYGRHYGQLIACQRSEMLTAA